MGRNCEGPLRFTSTSCLSHCLTRTVFVAKCRWLICNEFKEVPCFFTSRPTEGKRSAAKCYTPETVLTHCLSFCVMVNVPFCRSLSRSPRSFCRLASLFPCFLVRTARYLEASGCPSFCLPSPPTCQSFLASASSSLVFNCSPSLRSIFVPILLL